MSYKERMYDKYVTDGGSDKCYQNGMNGKCGLECSILGERDCCFDGWSLEDLEYCFEETDNSYVKEKIEEMKNSCS